LNIVTIFIIFNIGIFCGWLIAKYLAKNRFKEYELEAKAKAEIIKKEANNILNEAKTRVKEIEIESKQLNIIAKEKEQSIDRKLRTLSEKDARLDSLILKKEKQIKELNSKLSNISSMSKR